MSELPGDILTVVIAVIVILVFIAAFVLVMLIYFNNRKLQNARDKERLKYEYEQALLQTRLDVQETTMRQISQEIHDNVGQILSLVNLHLQTLPTSDLKKLEDTTVLVNKAITDLRILSKSLHPENLARQGMAELVRREFLELEKTGQFKTSLELKEEIELPADKVIVMYRMLQEVLNNIIKHSGAENISAEISRRQMVIADDGKGFNIDAPVAGIGLLNLQQRANAIGASMSIQSELGKGTIVTFNV